MSNKLFIFLIMIACFSSCTSTNIKRYYFKNSKILDDIELDYKKEYAQHPFSLEYADKSFKNISLEIHTDSIKLIYGFNISESNLHDTLSKYHFTKGGIDHLLEDMRSIGCIWLSKLDYYVDGKKKLLVFMSIREKGFHILLTKRKYYILSYFEQPQYFDPSGKLLNKRRQKVYRKIHGDIFKRITNKVAYTISDRFR